MRRLWRRRSARQASPTDGSTPTELERVMGWFDERTGFGRYARTALRKVFPDHWSFLLGEVALFCFIILVATGTFLTFFYTADARLVTYDGTYEPLRGAEVSAAYASVLHISFDVRAGLLMRQIHHWTALVFLGVIALHMMRVFFSGAFRRPRELNWLIGVTLLLLALALGFTGYSLPDDQLSGTGMRITYGALLSIPFVGPSLAFLVFGGEFPTEFVISRFFVFHVMLLPGLVLLLVSLHLVLVWLQRHTAYKGTGATEQTVVGPRFWPVQVFRSIGLFFLTAAVLAGMSGIFEINPVWSYGPFLPHVATVPAQPDWYVGWLEGALRLGLPFEPTILGVTIPTPFIPGVLVPGIVFGVIALWPWIEAFVTRDRRPHHLLDWPWEAAGRTATGVAVLTFFLVQTVAGGNDVLAVTLRMDVDQLNAALRVLLVVLPIVLWVLTYRLCRERQR
ncbi:MAG: cytochrome b N-terminal domain-containing protein, partial [Chloroflexota bacterium]|nr:cytochrome b N-terminal domain-containing protein [Chloroflexota bacterium]